MKYVPCSHCGDWVWRKKVMPIVSCPACLAKKYERYRTGNPTAYHAAQQKWRSAHRGYLHEQAKLWKADHPERAKQLARKAHRKYRKREKQRNKALVLSLPCLDCGLYHNEETRLRIIRRMLPCEAQDVAEAHPCLWSGIAGDQRLYRDLRNIAVRIKRIWVAKEQRAGA